VFQKRMYLAVIIGIVSSFCLALAVEPSDSKSADSNIPGHEYPKIAPQLRDLTPIHHSRPQTTPPDVVQKIFDLSLKNPMWGCCRLSNQLRRQGVSVSNPIIQNILIKNDIGSRYERLTWQRGLREFALLFFKD